MNNLPAIAQDNFSSFKILSLEDIEAAFYGGYEIVGFLVTAYLVDQDRLKHIELYHARTLQQLEMDRDGWVRLMN